MPEIPEGAKVPQDHLAPVDHTPEEDELLVDLPALTPPTRLRLRQRNKIMSMAMRLNELQTEDGQIELEANDPKFNVLLDVLADIDEFAEAIAENKADYVEWALAADYEKFAALLTRYASAVGESSSSSS